MRQEVHWQTTPLPCAYCTSPSFKGWIKFVNGDTVVEKCPYCGEIRMSEDKSIMSKIENEKWCEGTGRGRGVRPVVTVPLDEFSLLNRRVGFLEGVIEGTMSSGAEPDALVSLGQAMQKYKDICEK